MAKHPKKKKISVVLLFDLKSWHVQFWGLVLSNESAVLVWNVDLCILRVDKEQKRNTHETGLTGGRWCFAPRPSLEKDRCSRRQRVDRNVQRRIRATCECSSHTSLEISFDNHGRKKHQAKRVWSVSTCGANRLPWMGNAAAAFSHPSWSFSLALQAFVMLRSVFSLLTFANFIWH